MKSSLRNILGFCSKLGFHCSASSKKHLFPTPSSNKSNRFGIENNGNSTGAGIEMWKKMMKIELSFHYTWVTLCQLLQLQCHINSILN